ncbi:MAG TPA: xanthine dehydrogenase family protein subunit M [Terriglobales bacterium]|nr:xanthine dehydrogenase family protein subunit M [Terriglobales bacterium]
MRLRPFALAEPESVPEAVEILARLEGETRIIAGGTALVPTMRLGLATPDRLVSLHRIPGLSQIRMDKGTLEIGAMSSLAALARHDAVRSRWPLLAEAAGRVATPAIRSIATLGGNLCYAEAASDPAPALLCLDTRVRVADSVGERVVPIGEFFTGFYDTAVAPNEILTGVSVPAAPAGARSGYVKFCPRSAEDKPLIGVAALLVLDAAKRVGEIRIALGGAAPTPMRARRAEAAVKGRELTDAVTRDAAEAAAAEAEPLSDLMGSVDYRREMIRVWVRRLLLSLGSGS